MTFHHHGFIHRFLLHVLPEDPTSSATTACWPAT